MSKGSNPSSVTTTTSTEPSEFIKPYYTQAINSAQELYENPNAPSFFPNNTYVDFAPETNTALQLASARAIQGNPLLGSSQQEINKILSGDYLDPTSNPYAQSVYNQMAGDVTSQVNSQFTNAGRFGSGANQEILARSLGELGNKFYGDQYNQERANMVNATQIAPQLGEMDYNDIAKLQQIGQEKESLEMAKLQDAIARYDYDQTQPYQKLNQYLGSLGAAVPSNTLSTQPVFRNTGAGLLSGAMSGAEIAGMIPGIGGGMGAGIGGLLGGFF
jgi:hypothetical protein|tara:strand:+ start:109 stop:930 length:822 start_codon:yes stop_codon:yes gene_type:complete